MANFLSRTTPLSVPVTFENAKDTLIPYLSMLGSNANNEPWFEKLERDITDNGGMRELYRNENGSPVLYMRRYYVYRGPEREIMLHQFFLGDKGSLHDHPASSWGCILKTGYNERLCTHIANGRTEGEYTTDRQPGDWTMRPGSNANHDDYNGFHKVKLRDPVRDAGNVHTLFVMEKRNENAWGFRSNEGIFIPFTEMYKIENTTAIQASPDDFEYGWFPSKK